MNLALYSVVRGLSAVDAYRGSEDCSSGITWFAQLVFILSNINGPSNSAPRAKRNARFLHVAARSCAISGVRLGLPRVPADQLLSLKLHISQ